MSIRVRVSGAAAGIMAIGLAIAVISPLAPAAASATTISSTFATQSGGSGTCDPIAPVQCQLPFPNDWFSRVDPTTTTGRRLAFTPGTLLTNSVGTAMSSDAIDRSDGFSPGSPLITVAPGIDLSKTGLAPITDIAKSLLPSAPAVLVDMTTGTRWPYWAELDSTSTDSSRQALMIRPATNFIPGHSYAIGLRGFVTSNGMALVPSAAFAKVRGATLAASDPLRSRQAQLEPVFSTLTAAGVSRSSLYLAWGFTVASETNLSQDLIAMRDSSFAKLGTASPAFTVTAVTNYTAAQDPDVARMVDGTVTVPNYLSLPGGAIGSTLTRGLDGLPAVYLGQSLQATFKCIVPRKALTTPSNASLYGHGLLGSITEVTAPNVEDMAAEQNFTFCATPWIGMASEDSVYLDLALASPNLFQSIPDRMRQGLLNAMFVGRAMIAAGGFTSNAAFQSASGASVINTAAGLGYDGNSQGGIMGGALVAASPDIHNGVLGVTGMNYGLLLNRSSDFPGFEQIISVAFPDKLNQQILLALLQLQWDRGETEGYAAGFSTSPLPNTPAKRVLMQVAFGDHQVANIAADVEARTIGAAIPAASLAAGRSPDVTPYWNIARIPAFPFAGSAMTIWDSGSPAPPTTNTAPTVGHDPHEDPRADPAARVQKGTFLRTGTVVDVCAGAPCIDQPVSD